MKKVYNIWMLLFAIVAFYSCKSDDDTLADPYIDDTAPANVVYTSGSADFSNYVAVGNSLTAGYSDNALFAKGQAVSYPNVMATQFALAGGGAFTQPTMADDIGGLLLGGTPIAPPRLIFDPVNQVPTIYPGVPTTDVTNIAPGPYNNMGVPGAKSYHLMAPGYGNIAGVAAQLSNPYYVRMASDPNATVIADAAAMNPTFFSLWIGNNDVLGYATSGGTGLDHNVTGNLDPTTYAGNDITNTMVFTQVYSGLVQAMTANGADGILANIPDVTTVPYFTTVPYNPVPLDATTAGQVNAGFAPYNAGLQQAVTFSLITQEEADARTITFSASDSNAVVIEDEDLTDLSGLGLPSYRQATADDLIVLTAMTHIGTTVGGNPTLINGVTVPLADQWVLTPDEQTLVLDATMAFNQVIADAALANDLAFFDANAFMHLVANGGLTSGSVTVTSDFVTGGAFSLDGVHPSPRGYAIIANEMINVINTKYASNLPEVNPANYTGVYLD